MLMGFTLRQLSKASKKLEAKALIFTAGRMSLKKAQKSSVPAVYIQQLFSLKSNNKPRQTYESVPFSPVPSVRLLAQAQTISSITMTCIN